MLNNAIRGFDLSAFKRANPDLSKFPTPGLRVYLLAMGYWEIRRGKRRFHPRFEPFSEERYQEEFPDVRGAIASGKLSSAYDHFRKHGYREIVQGIRPWPTYRFDFLPFLRELVGKSGWFDPRYYLENNPDLVGMEMDPLEHFLLFGAEEGRNPNPFFDVKAYLTRYPDIASSGINPLVHYLIAGQTQGRSIASLPIGRNWETGTLPLVTAEEEEKVRELKIAVVIHAFYLDVLEDIVESIDRIDPRPDLFVSVAEDADVSAIREFLEERGYPRVEVRAVRNRGRDVAPFLVEFAAELFSYDLCCKIHGKKSLYAGSEQSNWRNHLYHNLLGSEEIVGDILNAFAQDERLGLLFSDNYGMLPYWGYTWLTNRPLVPGLLAKLGIQELSPILERTYIDYPAGTMFWFRPKAIEQILKGPLDYEDFPPEPIPNDGTIAHTLERLFAYVCRMNGYDFVEQNWKRRSYSKNITHKNFNQLEAKTLQTAKEIVDRKNCVVFDIFDTLVSRTIYHPDNLFRILEKEADTRFGRKTRFLARRKEVEAELRQSLRAGEDVSYSEIYDALSRLGEFTPEELEFFRERDFGMELEVLRPRPEVVELLAHARQRGKEILFVSDMYLEKEQVGNILDHCGIEWEEESLLVSSETGYRKDNGTVWKYLIEEKGLDPSRTLMIGDNEVSDAKIPGDFAIESFHLFSERTAFSVTPMGEEYRERFEGADPLGETLMGPVVRRLFESPFELGRTVVDFDITLDPYFFGHSALGPMFYLFMEYLATEYRDKPIFFLSRDGYFLKKIYEHYAHSKGLEIEGRSRYLQISRRAVLGAIEKDEKILKNILFELGEYEGDLLGLLTSRLGLDERFLTETGIENYPIRTAEDLQRTLTMLTEHLETINRYAREEREAYLAYLDEVGLLESGDAVVVDLGYSGTIQGYLHRLTDVELDGVYFVTTNKVSRVEGKENRIHGFFGDKIDPADLLSNIVYRYSLILESYLVSEKGQLIRYEREGETLKPVYKDDTHDIEIQEKITEGVMAYIDDLKALPIGILNPEDPSIQALALFPFEYFIRNRMFSGEMRDMLHLEDDFTGKNSLDVLEILDERGV